MTMGYGILIHLGEFDLRLLPHECPMHQVEAAGGLEAFLARYLKQIADFTTTRPTSRLPKRTN
jgi:hypothetical protein